MGFNCKNTNKKAKRLHLYIFVNCFFTFLQFVFVNLQYLNCCLATLPFGEGLEERLCGVCRFGSSRMESISNGKRSLMEKFRPILNMPWQPLAGLMSRRFRRLRWFWYILSKILLHESVRVATLRPRRRRSVPAEALKSV